MTVKKKQKEPAPSIGDRLVTLREAADVLRLSTRTVREYVNRGEIRGRIIGKRWRFRRVDLDAFFENAPPNWESCHVDPYLGSPHNHVELKRTDGSITVLRIVWRMLPRNGGRALFLLCPHCNIPRRFVYGWEWDWASRLSNRVRQVSWRCRSCNRLRYSSEGGYLRPAYGRLGQLGNMLRALGNLPRPERWFPYVFTSIDDPAIDEIVRLNRF